MRENADQNSSKYKQFLRSTLFLFLLFVKYTKAQIYLQQNIELLIKTILKLSKDFQQSKSNFVKEIFYLFSNLTHRKNNFYAHTRNTIKFGDKSLDHFGHVHGTHFRKKLV